jgi:Flp pilus assembly protein TadG
MRRIRIHFRPNEQGQSIVILALFFFLAFLVFAALSVDGTMIYLRRRQLQNMADAAALAAAERLSQNKDEATAYQSAMDSIAGNGGRVEWYSTLTTPNPITTNVGSGLNLIKGIQITNACDVRVALQWSDMGTYFTQFFGRQTLQVGARAHAGCNKAGGLQPIAVKRFGDEFDTYDGKGTPPNKKKPSTIYCGDNPRCDTRLTLSSQGNGTAYDFLRPSGLDVITTWPTGTLLYQSPSPYANKDSGAPGREYFILGQGVGPNVGNSSYGGWVNLDIRHISSPPREYYNGVYTGTNTNTLKDLGEYYIRHGYCCDIPEPGDEVAMLSGVSADFAAKAFQETYDIGDVVAVIVYNGTVYHSPDLELTGNPGYQHTRPATTTIAALNSAAVTYTIKLEGHDGFKSSPGGLTMNVEGLDGFAAWSLSDSSPPLPPYESGPDVIFLTLHITPTARTTVTAVGTTTVTTTQVITGTRMFYVSAIDDKFAGTKIRRYWAGVVTVGDKDSYGNDRDLPAVTATPSTTEQHYPFLTVEQGNQATYNVDLDLWGGATNQPVSVDFVGAKGFGSFLPTGFSWVSAPPWADTSVQATKHPGGSVQVKIKVTDTSVPNRIEELTFLTTAGTMTQTFKLYIQVVPSKTSDPENYVQILGYAALEVMGYPGVNSVRGRIISELWDDPSKLTYGLRARLIPWES